MKPATHSAATARTLRLPTAISPFAAARTLSRSTAISLFATAAALILPPAVVPAAALDLQQPILLRMTPPEGQVSRYAVAVQMEMDGAMPSMSGPLMTVRAQQLQTVLAVEGDVIRYRSTLDSVTTSQAMPGMDAAMDFPEGSFTMEIDTRGQPLAMTDADGAPAGTSSGRAGIFQSMSLFVLPEEEVGPGDTWTQEVPMALPMGSGDPGRGMEMTYALASLEGDVATISFEGPMDAEMDAMGMSVEVAGTVTGEMVVDLAAGRYLSMSQRSVLDMNMGAMTMGMTATMSMELMPGS